MRTFDAIGAAAVGAWLIVTSLYVYRHERATPSSSAGNRGEAVIREGETWMILRRDGDDVGFAHRARTRLESGWLVEYDMLVVVDIFDTTLPVETEVRAKLDLDARLRELDATVRAAGRTFHAQGDVQGESLSLVLQSGEDSRRHTIPLRERPRLATNSAQSLLGRDALEPGDSLQNDFFDPTSMGLRSIEMVYRGRTDIEVMGESHRAHHLQQRVAGTELDLYLDEAGAVLVQEFPLEIIGTRVRPELGRTRAASLRNEARAAQRNLEHGELGTGVARALDMLGWSGGLAPGPSPDAGDEADDRDGRHLNTGGGEP